MTAARNGCGWGDRPMIPTLASRRKRRRRTSSSTTSLFGTIVAAAVGASSSFVPPRSPWLKFAPGPSSYAYELATSLRTRRSGKIRLPITSRSTSLFVSLEPPSTAPSDSDELVEADVVRLNPSEHGWLAEVAVMNSSEQLTVTPPDTPKDSTRGTPEKLTQEAFPPLGETEEQRMEDAERGGDGEELTELLAHILDLRRPESPSIPVSYDEYGVVQADVSEPYFNPLVSKNNETIVVDAIGVDTPDNKDPEYPAFIKLLYQKDSDGQTLASKLFNLTLLLASFGYVLATVFGIDSGMTRGWSPAEIGMRIPLDTWASYETSLSEKPVATKTIINIVIYLLGDWLSQTIFQRKNILDFDAGRTLKNGFVGMWFGPAVHEYYEFSDWVLPVDGAILGITNRAYKILMDQTIYLSVKCAIYIIAIGVLNGESLENSSENVKNRIRPIMFTAWKFWPLVHCVTYGLVPARHRILWVNSVDLVWNAILASKARDDDDLEEENVDSESERESPRNGANVVPNTDDQKPNMFTKLD